jgi:hypothetical protein
MKSYVIATGALFGLITIAHIWRIIAEWPHLAKNPSYLLLTLAAAAPCLWACRLVKLSPRP